MDAVSLIKPPLLVRLQPPRTLLRPSPSNSKSTASPVTCGPRGNRPPISRGRTLSTEAILAVQALKRAGADDSKIGEIASRALSRLIRADLLAALAELQRQGQWRLALKAFVAVHKEFRANADYSLYAETVDALARHRMEDEIDLLVSDLVEEPGGGVAMDDVRGLARLVRALIGAGRGKAATAIYKAMKRGGYVFDEGLFKVLIRGLRRLGEGEAADEVEKDFETWFQGVRLVFDELPGRKMKVVSHVLSSEGQLLGVHHM